MKSLVYGEVLWDIYPEKSVIGGAPFNFAAHLSLLGDEVRLITGVGRDSLGEDTLECIRRYGIGEDYIALTDKPTGSCVVALGEGGIPKYSITSDTAYDNIELSDGETEEIKNYGADLFYFNTLAQRSPVSRQTLKKLLCGVRFENIMCDLNIRPNCYDADSIKLCLENATIVKISSEEAHFLTETGAVRDALSPIWESLHAEYPNIKLLVYTMGADGSAVYDYVSGEAHFSGKPGDVKVVSTVGAGDCYGASFVHYCMAGHTIDEAIHLATERSNIVVANTEAIPPCLEKK
ncbi:MAG: PfkB family carbohydrate kinase [Eubacteriales bacterium]